jgi:hypothetical protein
LGRDAELIADRARIVAAELRASAPNGGGSPSRFATSPDLRPCIAAASERVLNRALERFDARQPERFLPAEALDDVIAGECAALLAERLRQPSVAGQISAGMQSDAAAAKMLEHATTDLMHCGCDRRTLLFAPRTGADNAVIEQLRAGRPLAGVVSADVVDAVVVTEGAGFSPRSLALAIERIYPGIKDAAHRLQTRIDVEWRRLA